MGGLKATKLKKKFMWPTNHAENYSRQGKRLIGSSKQERPVACAASLFFNYYYRKKLSLFRARLIVERDTGTFSSSWEDQSLRLLAGGIVHVAMSRL